VNAPLPLGIVYGMAAERYHADPSVSNTMLSAMNKSPAHCYALHLDPERPPNKPTDAMSAGTLAHTAILEPDDLLGRYVVKPDGMKFSTREGMAWRDQQPAGVHIISSDEFKTAVAQRAAVMRVGELRRLFSSGVSEASLFWTDEATGLRCRARPDWLHFVTPKRVIALDVKTIADLTPDAVERAVTAYGYHRQRAHYVNGLKACGLEVEDFGFAFVSGSYPFIAAAHLLDDETISQGEDEVAELLARFADCQERGEWPAFGDGFQLTGLTRWARRNSEVEVGFVE
jgi:exodeoxyribonuclease VIII